MKGLALLTSVSGLQSPVSAALLLPSSVSGLPSSDIFYNIKNSSPYSIPHTIISTTFITDFTNLIYLKL